MIQEKRNRRFRLIVIVGSQIVAHTQMKTGDGPNKSNTINLKESGPKNWANNEPYNSY